MCTDAACADIALTFSQSDSRDRPPALLRAEVNALGLPSLDRTDGALADVRPPRQMSSVMAEDGGRVGGRARPVARDALRTAIGPIVKESGHVAPFDEEARHLSRMASTGGVGRQYHREPRQ